jgi:hypothetical protein
MRFIEPFLSKLSEAIHRRRIRLVDRGNGMATESETCDKIAGRVSEEVYQAGPNGAADRVIVVL